MADNPGGIFILPGAVDMYRNGDQSYPLRQDSNLYYLTGYVETDAWLVLAPAAASSPQGKGGYRTVLFVQHRDLDKEMWNGERYGTDRAMKIFGADEAHVIDELDKKLPELFAGAEKVFYRLGTTERGESNDRRVLAAMHAHRRSLGRTGKPVLPVFDPNGPLGEMRLFKTPEEVELIRTACRITAAGHKHVMENIRPGMNEGDIQTMIEHEFRRGGASCPSFGTIAAGGKNAACLHYMSNNEPLRDGELVLVDAGAEYAQYSGDITRTFPVGRKFSPAQARIYDVVLKAQKAGVAACKPGVTITGVHKRVSEVMIEGLLSLGLLSGDVQEIFTNNTHKRFFPHNTSHWMGLDVHDAGLYLNNDGSSRTLEPGMLFSVEPGFYVQPGDTEASAEYQGIGIRIEDDVLITRDGCENLTTLVPKERAEIEALRSK